MADSEPGSLESGRADRGAERGGAGKNCDGSPVFVDPFHDKSLRLGGSERFGLDAGPHSFSWICVKESARLNVCKDTTIDLAGGEVTVIGGEGIGALGTQSVSITINAKGQDSLYVLVNTASAPVTLKVQAPECPLVVVSEGKNMFTIGAVAASIDVYGGTPLSVEGLTATNGGVAMRGGTVTFPPCP